MSYYSILLSVKGREAWHHQRYCLVSDEASNTVWRKGFMKYASVIQDELWDQAHWVATAFAFPPVDGGIPAMALAFEHEHPAVNIFQQWHATFGSEDTEERIRVAIIEGDIPGQPEGYTIHVTTNPAYLVTQIERTPGHASDHQIATLCRFNRMGTTHLSQGLGRFKTTVKSLGKYLLLPAIYNQHVSAEVRPLLELAIVKREIHFRHVHEIAPSDIDAAVIAASRQ